MAGYYSCGTKYIILRGYFHDAQSNARTSGRLLTYCGPFSSLNADDYRLDHY